jgi:cytochrome c-type biogenesis protein CcmH/NrfG
MNTNPYTPPDARLRDPESATLSWKISWIAAAAGTGTAYFLTCIVSPFLQHYYAGGSSNVTEVYQAMITSTGFIALALFICAGSYVLGGHLAASLAPDRPFMRLRPEQSA